MLRKYVCFYQQDLVIICSHVILKLILCCELLTIEQGHINPNQYIIDTLCLVFIASYHITACLVIYKVQKSYRTLLYRRVDKRHPKEMKWVNTFIIHMQLIHG